MEMTQMKRRTMMRMRMNMKTMTTRMKTMMNGRTRRRSQQLQPIAPFNLSLRRPAKLRHSRQQQALRQRQRRPRRVRRKQRRRLRHERRPPVEQAKRRQRKSQHCSRQHRRQAEESRLVVCQLVPDIYHSLAIWSPVCWHVSATFELICVKCWDGLLLV